MLREALLLIETEHRATPQRTNLDEEEDPTRRLGHEEARDDAGKITYE